MKGINNLCRTTLFFLVPASTERFVAVESNQVGLHFAGASVSAPASHLPRLGTLRQINAGPILLKRGQALNGYFIFYFCSMRLIFPLRKGPLPSSSERDIESGFGKSKNLNFRSALSGKGHIWTA
jgi:hypothetical protein